MEVIVDIIRYGAPLALVVMGAAVSVCPPPRENRRAVLAWIAAFGIVGILITGVQVYSDANERAERKALQDQITGGDNYAFFIAEPKVAPNGENYLTVTTTGPMPIFDCSIRFLSPNGEISGSREWAFRPLPKTTARFAHTTLPPGRYRADCIMGEKVWRQDIEFTRRPNGIDQTFRVMKDNQVMKEGP